MLVWSLELLVEVSFQFADYQDIFWALSVVVCTALAVVAFVLVKKRKYGISGRSVISLFDSSRWWQLQDWRSGTATSERTHFTAESAVHWFAYLNIKCNSVCRAPTCWHVLLLLFSYISAAKVPTATPNNWLIRYSELKLEQTVGQGGLWFYMQLTTDIKWQPLEWCTEDIGKPLCVQSNSWTRTFTSKIQAVHEMNNN